MSPRDPSLLPPITRKRIAPLEPSLSSAATVSPEPVSSLGSAQAAAAAAASAAAPPLDAKSGPVAVPTLLNVGDSVAAVESRMDELRRLQYPNMYQKGSRAAPAAHMGLWLTVLLFFATPPGLAAFALGMHFCTGLISVDTVLARPWTTLLQSSLCMAAASILFYLPLALQYDRAYLMRPLQRCQPRKTHSVAGMLSRSEVRLAFLNLAQAAFFTCALVVSHTVAPAGKAYDRIYLSVEGWSGWLYLLVSAVLFFLWTDLAAFTVHRLLHLPWAYRRIHKWHHAHVQPTAFSSLALHPGEMFCMQAGVFLGLFLIPLHPAAILANLLYIHIHNVIDHSGVYLESWLPWQPTTLFHDDHHRFFHVNYGQSLMLWDRLLGTMYTPRRRYGEARF